MGMRRSRGKAIGATGLNVTGWGELGEEFLNEWKGAREKAKRVNEMLSNSPIIGAVRSAIEMPILDIEWQWVSDEDNENDPRLEFINGAWERLDWRMHLIEALSFVFYGWCTFSIGYEQREGRWVWSRFKMLGQETVMRWQFDGDDVTGLQQLPHLWPDVIPVDRMVHYKWRAIKGNPEGASILRPAWVPWWYIKNLQQIEAIGIERNLAGLPVIILPEGADPTESTDPNTDFGRATTVVRNIRQDEQAGLVLPFGWEFNLVASSGGSKVTDTDVVMGRYNKQILMSTLSQFLSLGMENVGALATFEGANDFFTLAINAIADIIADVFTKQAAYPLFRLNGMDPDGIKLDHAPAGNVAADKMMAAIQMADSRVTWTPEDEAWLRDLFRMPHKDVEELEVLQAERKAEAAAIAASMPRQPFGRQQEDMGVTVYAAGDTDPYEQQYQTIMAGFLQGQERRLVKAAKRG